MISRDSDASVVLVEDPLICRFVRSVLLSRKRSVVEVGPAEAIRLVQSGDAKVRLLITNRPDAFLPFTEELPVLYLSSLPEHRLAGAFRECRMLHKPFAPGALSAAVTELIGPVVV
jgi:hypothetical protein